MPVFTFNREEKVNNDKEAISKAADLLARIFVELLENVNKDKNS